MEGEAEVTLTCGVREEFAALLVVVERLRAVRRVQISELTARLRVLVY